MAVPTVTLNDGAALPRLGIGVFQVPPRDTAANVAAALELGYRHIDTARIYGNEREVGEGLRASGLPRDEVWITTKLWNDDQGRDTARGALEASLERLGLDRVDLYLIHWPVPRQDRYVETWEALVELQRDGLTRSIGVSNFQPDNLRRAIEATGVVPAVNQIELHPYLQQGTLVREHAEHGIVTESWSPLAQGAVLDDPVIARVAEAHGRTPAQVVVRWHLHKGFVTFPKSSSAERLRENLDALAFELTEDDLYAIDSLDQGRRVGFDPETFG
ncbi:MAG TPA: aldo/keto reductase [Baekduia sp.]|nr:aldo/keto reductase [Baekduia sp.]